MLFKNYHNLLLRVGLDTHNPFTKAISWSWKAWHFQKSTLVSDLNNELSLLWKQNVWSNFHLPIPIYKNVNAF